MGDLVPFRRISGAVHELSDEALVSAAGANGSPGLASVAITLLIDIRPASAPEISMAIIVTLKGEIPAYFAAGSDRPKARIS